MISCQPSPVDARNSTKNDVPKFWKLTISSSGGAIFTLENRNVPRIGVHINEYKHQPSDMKQWRKRINESL